MLRLFYLMLLGHLLPERDCPEPLQDVSVRAASVPRPAVTRVRGGAPATDAVLPHASKVFSNPGRRGDLRTLFVFADDEVTWKIGRGLT